MGFRKTIRSVKNISHNSYASRCSISRCTRKIPCFVAGLGSNLLKMWSIMCFLVSPAWLVTLATSLQLGLGAMVPEQGESKISKKGKSG
jgi:hypothetical protein